MPRVTVHRKAHFNAAHRLFNPDWSDEKNLEVFGKCSNPHYHGHNYARKSVMRKNHLFTRIIVGQISQ